MRLRGQRQSPQKRHQPLRLEQLEDRTLLSGDLLVAGAAMGSNYNLIQYSQQGGVLSSQPIPLVPGSTQYQAARGLTVDPSGNVDVFDGVLPPGGTLTPALATLSAATNIWSSPQTVSGWGTNGNISYGNVVAYNNYVFASNMQSSGMVRFDDSGGSPELFAPGVSFVQIALGQNGLLYGLENAGGGPTLSQTVEVFNPDTLAQVGNPITLTSAQPIDIRSIAVDGSGNIFAASWGGTIAEYDSKGNPTGASLQLPDNLMSIALDTDGQIAVSGHRGSIYLTNESLTSEQSFRTNLSVAYVTFDHYIGAAPQKVTPTFTSLTGPTITYGQSTVTLGGTITASTGIPPGSVNITLDGMTETAAINPNDGTFSAIFNTSGLGVSGSPYTITYSYAGQNNYAGVTDTSKSLTVTQATTTLSNLSSPTVVIGTTSTTVSGKLGSNSVLPVGQSVTVTLLGSNGSVTSGSGVIGSDGSFSASLNTAALPAGSYTIQYSYAGDANFQGSSGTATLQVTYAVKNLFPLSRPIHAGAALPVILQVNDASGNNLSSAGLTVTAVSLIGPNGQIYTPQPKGRANPGNVFRHVGPDYVYILNTRDLPAGTYTLLVKVGNDPVLHAVTFTVCAPRHGEHHIHRVGHSGHHTHRDRC
jgi:hypothetical protein